MESEQLLRRGKVQSGIGRALCLAPLLLALSAPSAAARAYDLAPRLAAGQVIAYDGTYLLAVPGAAAGKGITLASIAYGLIFRVEAVDGQGATVSAEFDRFESRLRGVSTAAYTPLGKRLRFHLTPRGRLEEPEGDLWAPVWSGLLATWTGWPDRLLSVGETWDTTAETFVGPARAALSRTYRLCEVGDGEGGHAFARLDYVERGSITASRARLPDGEASLEGTVLGVGQARLDLTLGRLMSAASVSTFTGEMRRPGAEAVAVRLETEITVGLRQTPVPRNP